jgi:cytosine/adenosine deaminase-related metal-dependent hydrolase
MATLGGARALGWDATTGSLEEGKDADMLVLRAAAGARSIDDVLSALIFDNDDLGVEAVYLRGRRLDAPRA